MDTDILVFKRRIRMKKAWAFGLAAMLGLGVSTVMADQASAFAASAPPTAAETTTQNNDTDQKNTDDQTGVQADISSEASQTPVITVAETSESVIDDSSASNSGSQQVEQASQSSQVSDNTSATSSSDANATTEAGSKKTDAKSEASSSSVPTIKTEQESNKSSNQPKTKRTAEEQKEQAMVVAAQAATHDNVHVKTNQGVQAVTQGTDDLTTSDKPHNTLERLWQALIESVAHRQQCPVSFENRVIVTTPTTNLAFIKDSLTPVKKHIKATFSDDMLKRMLQNDFLKPLQLTFKDVTKTLNQIMLVLVILPDSSTSQE